jgi:hypothetical protein
LFAPAAVLAAALLVAVGGSGADALSSLGQLASGPAVPLSSVDAVNRASSGGADVSDLDGENLASAGATRARARATASRHRAEHRRADGSGSSGSRAERGGSTAGGSGPAGGGGGVPSSGGGGQAPAATSPRAPSGGQAPSSRPAPSSPTKPSPLGETLDQTQQQLDELLKPVKPITDQVLGGLGR